jgi:hypothetical protein
MIARINPSILGGDFLPSLRDLNHFDDTYDYEYEEEGSLFALSAVHSGRILF